MSNIQLRKRHDLNREIWKHIQVTDIVLDIGCGIRPQSFFTPGRHYCYEPCAEYVKILRERLSADERYCVLNDTAQNITKTFTPDSVDSVFLLDVIEHLTKNDGLAVIKDACQIARRQVIIYTPLGYRKQDIQSGEKDAWGSMISP